MREQIAPGFAVRAVLPLAEIEVAAKGESLGLGETRGVGRAGSGMKANL